MVGTCLLWSAGTWSALTRKTANVSWGTPASNLAAVGSDFSVVQPRISVSLAELLVSHTWKGAQVCMHLKKFDWGTHVCTETCIFLNGR